MQSLFKTHSSIGEGESSCRLGTPWSIQISNMQGVPRDFKPRSGRPNSRLGVRPQSGESTRLFNVWVATIYPFVVAYGIQKNAIRK
jgi:hypothetical protein